METIVESIQLNSIHTTDTYFAINLLGDKLDFYYRDWISCRDSLIYYAKSMVDQGKFAKEFFRLTMVYGPFTPNLGTVHLTDKALGYLNEVEDKLGIPNSVVYSFNAQGVPGYMFQGDKIWNISPVMVSLYILLVRCAWFSPEDTTLESMLQKKLKANPLDPWQDFAMLFDARKTLEWLFEYGPNQLFNKDNMSYKDIISKNWANIQSAQGGTVGYSTYGLEYCYKSHPDWYAVIDPAQLKSTQTVNAT